MILTCNYEELRALNTGADLFLADELGGGSAVAAPPAALALIEKLKARLAESIELRSLEEQRQIQTAVEAICHRLQERMEDTVAELHPAHEQAVAFYFDYAHSLAVLTRLQEIGRAMMAALEMRN